MASFKSFLTFLINHNNDKRDVDDANCNKTKTTTATAPTKHKLLPKNNYDSVNYILKNLHNSSHSNSHKFLR